MAYPGGALHSVRLYIYRCRKSLRICQLCKPNLKLTMLLSWAKDDMVDGCAYLQGICYPTLYRWYILRCKVRCTASCSRPSSFIFPYFRDRRHLHPQLARCLARHHHWFPRLSSHHSLQLAQFHSHYPPLLLVSRADLSHLSLRA